MKNAMIVLGIVLISLGTISGCKKKSDEEKVGELLEKLDRTERAGDERQARKIDKKIEELTRKQEKREEAEIKKIKAKIGKPIIFSQKDFFKEQETKLSITFENISTTRNHPILSRNSYLRGSAWAQAPEGKKYVVITAKIKNLGPRKTEPTDDIEVKTDKGTVPVLFDPDRFRPSEVPILFSDTSKIQRLGFSVSHSVRDIIKSQLNYYLDPRNRVR